MPNLDGKGPQGKGPLSGRRRGHCRDNQTEKSGNKSIENEETGYEFGFGRKSRDSNRGRGRRGRNQGSGRGFGRK